MTGVVEYSGANEEATPSAPYAIEELVALSDETLSLAPNEQKEITLTVQMPSESFDGILAGGLYVQQTGSEEFQGNVQNLLAREVAVLLRSCLGDRSEEGRNQSPQCHHRSGGEYSGKLS